MAVLTGVDERLEINGLLGISSDLSKGAVSFCQGSELHGDPTGAWSSVQPVAGQPWGIQGVLAPMHGGELFEKVIVLPRRVAMGYVLQGSTLPVEVWSTVTSRELSLEGIAVTGIGGITISGPATGIFGPGQAKNYVAALPTTGTPRIANLATWTFAGLSGADLTVTGTRLVVFSAPCDWSEHPTETPTWKTSILPGYNGAEQRIQLRQQPRYEISFRVVSEVSQSDLGTRMLEALLYGWQANQYGVPMWPEYSFLRSAVVAGSQTLSIDTANRAAFAVGGFGMIWRSVSQWEAFGITAITADSISIDTPLAGDWPVGSRVVPLRLGRLSASQDLGRPTNWLTDGTFTFQCEAAS